MIAGLVVHAAHGLTGFGGPTVDWLIVQGLYYVLLLVAVVLCAKRAREPTPERRAWTLITFGVACFFAGDLGWSFGLGDADSGPSVCELLYLAFYPAVLLGCARLAAVKSDHRPAASWLDALAAALAVGAAGSAFLLRDVFAGADGDGLVLAIALAYPALDLTLVAVVVGLAASRGWKLERQWAVLGAGLALGAVADAAYYVLIDAGTYVESSIIDSAWPTSLLLIALAATMRPSRRALPHAPSLILPVGLATIALAVLVADHFAAVPTTSIVLACAALVAVLGRAMLAFHENETMLARSRHEALTDGLTGLQNRRALSQRLDELVEEGTPSTLLLFDLDGFKLYNDTFGHPAGDALLVRLACRLREAVEGAGDGYRMGGDEFCVVLTGDAASTTRVELALRERGEGFDVGASFGAVALPAEAGGATEALRIADQRLYANKERRRASAGAQAGDALLRVLGEREPALHEHLFDVARLATGVAEQMGLDAADVAEVRRAAELHDIGKIAMPDLILHKPGPLTPGERAFIEQHTVIGQRILGAAPALRPVGRVVRSTHERWDGGGYPDGLAEDAIPVGARIVAACDAYDAMTSERPYSAAMDPADALAELQRCAGTQFDPEVVAAFARVSPSAPADPRPRPSAPLEPGRR